MVPVFIWVILMHYMDMYFNMMPEIHPDGPSPAVADLGALLLIGGTLIWVFLRSLFSHPICPLRDPRMREALILPLMSDENKERFATTPAGPLMSCLHLRADAGAGSVGGQ